MTVTTNHGALDTPRDVPSSQIARSTPDQHRHPAAQPRVDAASDPGGTLLPAPVASLVSVATRSTGLAVQLGSAIGGYGLDIAKDATLSSLGLGRTLLEGVLSRAAKSSASHSTSEPAGAEAEILLERAIENLHVAMGQILYWTAASFDMTTTTLSLVSETSQRLLTTLDQFFGSTESSRAMASIVTMVRRELANPPPGCHGVRASAADLIRAFCALAYLRSLCRALLEAESRRFAVEDPVWDVIVPNYGTRFDIDEEKLHRRPSTRGLAAIEGPEGLPTMRLEREIMKSLPDDVRVSITREIVTSETIRINIIGDDQQIKVEPPHGAELIRETRDIRQGRPGQQGEVVCSQFVFRHEWRQERSASFEKVDGDISRVGGHVEVLEPDSPAKSINGDEHAPRRAKAACVTRTSARHPDGRKSNSFSRSKPTHSSSSHQDVGMNSAAVRAVALSGSPSPGRTTSSAVCSAPGNCSKPAESAAVPPSAPRSQPGIQPARLSSTRVFSTGKHGASCDTELPQKRRGFLNTLRKPMSIFGKGNSGLDVAVGEKEHISVPPLKIRGLKNAQRALGEKKATTPTPALGKVYMHMRHSSSRTSLLAVPGSLTQSVVSLSESYSIAATDERQAASVFGEATIRRPIVKEVSLRQGPDWKDDTLMRHHRPTKSHSSSLSLVANRSEMSLASCPARRLSTLFGAAEALSSLRQYGVLDGMFPQRHFLANIARYMRFASASYGSSFLRALGIGTEMPIPRLSDNTPSELRSFAHHTRSDASSILLCSFVDQQGGSDATGSTNTGVPLVHYISLDHDSKAVVLTCRGTLNFEDVLTDMACDYDDLIWRGTAYKVHRGVNASAKRLLYGGDGRVLHTLKAALEEFPDYGLVLTGHSLGGAVTSVLGIMLSSPSRGGASTTPFVTAQEPHTALLPPHETRTRTNHLCLPANRPIHVYAYGPPATLSRGLRHATRGLITTVIHGADLVPYLSLGALHDLQHAAVALKEREDARQSELSARIWRALLASITDPFRNGSKPAEWPPAAESEEERWAYDTLQVLRDSMVGDKLVPPGEVFVVESSSAGTSTGTSTSTNSKSNGNSSSSSTAVVRRRGQVGQGNGVGGLSGKPARRVVAKYVRDVERRFGEIRFSAGMLLDHSPGRYEAALEGLVVGAGVGEG